MRNALEDLVLLLASGVAYLCDLLDLILSTILSHNLLSFFLIFLIMYVIMCL